MKAKINIETLEKIESLKSMMDSCYAYEQLSKDNEYIKKRIADLGEEEGNRIYDTYKIHLETNFRVEKCVYTDGEGLTYNNLIEIIK
jgi:metal-responsive CopG/Arc/MetJ family transcriptional regulator